MKKAITRHMIFTLGAFTSCASPSQPADFRQPECESGGHEVGTWQLLPFPEGMDSGIGSGTQDEFVLLGSPRGAFAAINILTSEKKGWETQSIAERIWADGGGNLVVTSNLVATSQLGHSDSQVDYPPNGVAVLDRKTLIWKVLAPPAAFGVRFSSTLHWTGTRLLLWGGAIAENGAQTVATATETSVGLDGYFVDPSTGEWEHLPAPWPDRDYDWGKQAAVEVMSSLWTPEGFFLFGISPDGKSSVSAIYEDGAWRYPQATHLPHQRIRSRLSYHDGYIYLFGGSKPGAIAGPSGDPGPYSDEFYSDFWRYSFSADSWERIEPPAYADLKGAHADWIGDKLLFKGFQCSALTIYDVSSGTWSNSAYENSPPSGGYVSSTGSRLVIHYVWGQIGPLRAVWTFDL